MSERCYANVLLLHMNAIDYPYISNKVLFFPYISIASQNLSVWASGSRENYACTEAVSSL